MNNIWTTIKSSVYDPAFYASLKDRKIGEAVKYILSLVFLIALVMGAYVSIKVAPTFSSVGQFVKKFVNTEYPADFIFSVKDGVASTTPARPFTLKLPPEVIGAEEIEILKTKGIENLLVINTNSDFSSLSQFVDSKSFVLITRDYFISSGKRDGGMQVDAMNKIPDFTLTKAIAMSFVSKIAPLITLAAPILFVFFLIVFFLGLTFGAFVSAVVVACLIWLIRKAFKKNILFPESFQSALYAVTPVLLLELVMFLFAVPSFSFPIFVCLVLIVWFVNSKVWEKELTTTTK